MGKMPVLRFMHGEPRSGWLGGHFIEKSGDPIEKGFAPFVDDVGMAGVRDLDPVGRCGEGVGETACFVDRRPACRWFHEGSRSGTRHSGPSR